MDELSGLHHTHTHVHTPVIYNKLSSQSWHTLKGEGSMVSGGGENGSCDLSVWRNQSFVWTVNKAGGFWEFRTNEWVNDTASSRWQQRGRWCSIIEGQRWTIAVLSSTSHQFIWEDTHHVCLNATRPAPVTMHWSHVCRCFWQVALTTACPLSWLNVSHSGSHSS